MNKLDLFDVIELQGGYLEPKKMMNWIGKHLSRELMAVWRIAQSSAAIKGDMKFVRPCYNLPA